MLCTVILVGTANVLHKGYCTHIGNKNYYLHYPFKKGLEGGNIRFPEKALKQHKQPCGQEHKEKDCKRYSKHHRNAHYSSHKLFAQLIVKPFLKLSKLLLLVLLRHSRKLSGTGKIAVALGKLLNKVYRATDKGRLVVPFPLLPRGFLKGDCSVRFSYRHSGFLRTLHHYSLNKRLSAYCGTVYFFLFSQFYAPS